MHAILAFDGSKSAQLASQMVADLPAISKVTVLTVHEKVPGALWEHISPDSRDQRNLEVGTEEIRWLILMGRPHS